MGPELTQEPSQQQSRKERDLDRGKTCLLLALTSVEVANSGARNFVQEILKARCELSTDNLLL